MDETQKGFSDANTVLDGSSFQTRRLWSLPQTFFGHSRENSLVISATAGIRSAKVLIV